ncbi:hypothetical protein Dsin_008958 [Dipteronia sinensis]|uniref:Reverse transcriptase zinc-binding domain-containing protein n=1 Tax=Dipteronia sinensis TaxID=43782 RepID=A0AAE0EB62_9ROSI|nr:hypothetical protein Dsin_008958 [Dipteronia sinensis]
MTPFNPNGIFSVGWFRRSLEGHVGENFPALNLVWQGNCPPKVEVFVWQVLRGRVMVKDHMHGLHYQLFNLNCHLCNTSIEAIDHLLNYEWTWRLWTLCMRWWEVDCCPNKTFVDWFTAWPTICLLDRLWKRLEGSVLRDGLDYVRVHKPADLQRKGS